MTREGVDQGQTNLDFLVGITLFVVTLTFVVGFMPQLVAPYEDQERPLVAERVASTIVESLLAEGDTPSTLNETCTGALFTDSDGNGCPFDGDARLSDQVDLSPSYRVNASLLWNVSGDADPEILCYNGGEIGECGTGRLAVGHEVPHERRTTGIQRRGVVVDGRPAILEVRVW